MNVSKLSILEFWKSHPEYWIAVGERQANADALITALYFPQFVDELPWLSAVIYCDQFMRHFSRCAATGVTEADVTAARCYAAELVATHATELLRLSEEELMFALMVWKHVGAYDRIFEVLHAWLPDGRSFTEFPVLNRFYKDTYTKMFEAWGVGMISCVSNIGSWDPVICESCPPRSAWNSCDYLPGAGEEMMCAVRGVARDGVIWISLSGGVDSNLMCALGRRTGLDVRAIHIVYGNRDVAEAEATFVADLCAALDVTLYVYRVPWIRRATADRAFYETVTRRIRFAVYRAVGVGESGVCLGHIREDVVENVWTNFAHGAHLENLAKMSAAEVEAGVRVLRPWLGVKKADVYAVAEVLNVPHLKNTTPAWSNRGKFRDAFYAATHAQYGAEVDAKILEVAAAYTAQAAMLERLLYAPVFNSWTEDGEVDVTPIFAAGGLDGAGWLRVLTHFCHSRLGIAKPSIHACRDLAARLDRPFVKARIPVKKGLALAFVRSGPRVTLKFE